MFSFLQAHLSKGLVDGRGRAFVALGLGGDLAGDEDLLSRNPAGPDALAHPCLIVVSLGGINEAVAGCHSGSDRFCRLFLRDEPGTKAQLWNLDAIGKRIGFVQNHAVTS